MTHKEILDYCLTKPGAYIDYPFGEDVTVVKVKAPSQDKGRIFAQLFLLKDKPKATFNCDAVTGEFYRSVYPETVTRGYHCPAVQQPYFNTVNLGETVPDDEMIIMIEHSYSTVVAKMPKYMQLELNPESEG